jgi:hypothetical protein
MSLLYSLQTASERIFDYTQLPSYEGFLFAGTYRYVAMIKPALIWNTLINRYLKFTNTYWNGMYHFYFLSYLELVLMPLPP